MTDTESENEANKEGVRIQLTSLVSELETLPPEEQSKLLHSIDKESLFDQLYSRLKANLADNQQFTRQLLDLFMESSDKMPKKVYLNHGKWLWEISTDYSPQGGAHAIFIRRRSDVSINFTKPWEDSVSLVYEGRGNLRKCYFAYRNPERNEQKMSPGYYHEIDGEDVIKSLEIIEGLK